MNNLYDYGRQMFLEGQVHWLLDDIKCCLVGSAYVPDLVGHQFLNAVSPRVALSTTLTGRTSTGGVADADDVDFLGVTGPPCSYVTFYKDTGNVNTSPLIALIDTATGLPVTPAGGDILVQWGNDPLRIFKL